MRYFQVLKVFGWICNVVLGETGCSAVVPEIPVGSPRVFLMATKSALHHSWLKMPSVHVATGRHLSLGVPVWSWISSFVLDEVDSQGHRLDHLGVMLHKKCPREQPSCGGEGVGVPCLPWETWQAYNLLSSGTKLYFNVGCWTEEL